jgi:hypothetical protein
MLTAAQLKDQIARKGPYLYHRSPADSLPLIARQGLVPWDAEEREDVPLDWDEGSTSSYADSRIVPRSDRIYVGVPGYVRRYDGVTLCIDLRKLEPLALGSDEDHFDSRVWGRLPEWVRQQLEDVVPPPREWGSWADYVDPDCPDCEGAGADDPAGCPRCEGTGKDIYADPCDEGTLGDWADQHAELLDAPEFVSYSLEQGSLAVKGSIPAAAVSIDRNLLAPKDLESIARAFAERELELEPFPVEHEGQTLTVTPDALGNFELPEGVPRWRVDGYVQERRGARLVELFNSGELRAHERPELADEALSPQAFVPSELELAGL